MTGLESAIRASLEAKHGSVDEAAERDPRNFEEEELVMHQTYPLAASSSGWMHCLRRMWRGA